MYLVSLQANREYKAQSGLGQHYYESVQSRQFHHQDRTIDVLHAGTVSMLASS